MLYAELQTKQGVSCFNQNCKEDLTRQLFSVSWPFMALEDYSLL